MPEQAEMLKDAVNDALHRMFDVTPCETGCTHVIVNNWTALGIANVFARHAVTIKRAAPAHPDGDEPGG